MEPNQNLLPLLVLRRTERNPTMVRTRLLKSACSLQVSSKPVNVVNSILVQKKWSKGRRQTVWNPAHHGTSMMSSRPNVKLGRLRPFMYLAAVCDSAVTRIGKAMVASQGTKA